MQSTDVGLGAADDAQVALVDGGLRLTVGDQSIELSAMWLRDSATDAESRDPVSGQRLFGITDVPADLRVGSATVHDGRLEVVFEPGGHRTAYDVGELLDELRHGHRDERNEQGKRLWRTAA